LFPWLDRLVPSPLERLARRRAAGRHGADLLQLVEQLTWAGEAPRKRFLPVLQQALEEAPEQRVVVAAGPQLDTWAELIAQAWPSLDPVLVGTDEDPSALHVRLALAGPFDVVLQAADGSALDQARLFSRLFFHVREGGVYLTPLLLPLAEDDAAAARAEGAAWLEEQRATHALPNEDGAFVPPYVGELWDVVAEAQKERLRKPEGRADRAPRTKDIRGLARHLGEVQVRGASLRIVNGRWTHVLLREDEADVVLRARPELGRELESLPATRSSAPLQYRHNLESDDYVRAEMAVPKLTLRRYDDPACSRGQVVTSGGFVWPDSYRHPLAPRLHNFYVQESGPGFGHLRRRLAEADRLAGNWFNLDSEWPGHYGHTLTELLGRMWAWDRVRELAPDVKCLMTLQPERDPLELVRFELDILGAFGITAADVHVFERPCLPETLYSATSMFSLPDYVHPDMVRTWDRVADHLLPNAQPGPRPRRIFCTRPADYKRGCTNTAAVEDLFARHGFEVIRPEAYPLADQIALFRGADAIGGFGGSALFTAALCDTPKTIVTVAPTSYTARNEHLIAAARGHRIVSAWSAPGIAHPEGWWSQEAYASSFTVDLHREGAWLEDQLAALGPPD
jgi:capsular polysaccharide biosynthesis protein